MLALVLALAAAPAAAAPEGSLLAGYAFRSATDGRSHGATASLGVDIPLASSLALRPEALLVAFNGSEAAPGSLALLGGALSLAYRFDDSDTRALVALGPLGGVTVDGDAWALRAGALLSLGLRFPVLDALDVEARVAVPAVLWGPRGFAPPATPAFADGSANDWPLQATFSLGLAADVGRLLGPP